MMIQLLDVQEHDADHLLAAVEVTDDDGNVVRMAHFMPKDTAEWRVAEYDLDPTDHDTIIDVLLFEGHVYANNDLAPEDRLHSAPTVAQTREALLGAVRARKATSDARKATARGRQADPEPEARQRMAELFRIDPDVVAAKREYVTRAREVLKAQASASPPSSSAAERAAAIRSIMNGSNNATGADH